MPALSSHAIIPVDYEDMKTGFQSPRAAGIADWLFRKEEAAFQTLVNGLRRKNWHKKNVERERARKRQWARDNSKLNLARISKWAKENPEKRKAIQNRYYAKPGVAARQVARSRQRRHEQYRAAAPVITCIECGAQFCEAKPRQGGVPRKFCSQTCTCRDSYKRSKGTKQP